MSELRQPGGISMEQSTHSALVINHMGECCTVVQEADRLGYLLAG